MPLKLGYIVWVRSRKVAHGEDGVVKERRVAGVFDENANPLKPKGTPPLARPFTLELYFPLPPGTDRVQKFTTLAAARAEAARQLARLAYDITIIERTQT